MRELTGFSCQLQLLSRREVTAVNFQTANKSGFANNLWLQIAVLVIVVAGLIAIAAKYIW